LSEFSVTRHHHCRPLPYNPQLIGRNLTQRRAGFFQPLRFLLQISSLIFFPFVLFLSPIFRDSKFLQIPSILVLAIAFPWLSVQKTPESLFPIAVQIIADLLSHSQFRFSIYLYLHMHGLISKTSISDSQDQTDIVFAF